MITIYGTKTCPHCAVIASQVEGNSNYNFIDIGEDVHNLLPFIRLRDNDAVFDEAKKSGSIGIPCFVLEDGTLSLNPEDAGLKDPSHEEALSCNIDGSGC